MKIAVAAASMALALWTISASAQTADREETSPFDGVKIGGTVDNRRHEGKFDISTTTQHVDEQAGGVGYRGFIGVDKALGNSLIVGAEAGVGNGGKNLKSTGSAGAYNLDPQWSWDISGRLGVTPSRDILLYARTGYNWLRTRETLVNVPANQRDFDRKTTRGGFLWGVGAEFAISHDFALRAEFNQTNFGKGLKAARLQFGGAVRF